MAPEMPMTMAAPARPFTTPREQWNQLHELLNNRQWAEARDLIDWIRNDGSRTQVASLVFRGHRFFTFYVDGDGESAILSTCFYMFLHV